jgi:hypothetical protein
MLGYIANMKKVKKQSSPTPVVGGELHNLVKIKKTVLLN